MVIRPIVAAIAEAMIMRSKAKLISIIKSAANQSTDNEVKGRDDLDPRAFDQSEYR